jgi:hypothetical protein
MRPARLLLVAATVFALWAASGAQAAESLYWNNYQDDPATIGFSNVDGSGGGAVSISGIAINSPEGMSYDTALNRIYIGDDQPGEATDHIAFVPLDGTGSGYVDTGATKVETPEGVAFDPASRIVYWLNAGEPESIGWAKVDGSGSGILNTAGATLAGAYRIAIDPVAGRVYWGNTKSGDPISISYGNFNGTGGGNLNITGVEPKDVSGLAVDPTAGKIYWDDEESIDFANLNGTGGGGVLSTAGSVFNEPYGLALDPATGKMYWANYGKTKERTGAFGFASPAGSGGGGINIASAPVNGPQDPLLLKSPSGTSVPVLARAAKAPAQLSCSQGTWAADLAGSSVFQAPRTFAYQWTLKGAPVAGATASTVTATKAGNYACVVTATNQLGSAAQTSAAATVKAAKLKLSVKKAKAKAGGTAKFKIKAVNQGDLQLKSAKVCVKLPKKSKKALKAPKCKAIKKVKGKGNKSTTLKVKVLAGTAPGSYKLTFTVKGGKSAKSAVKVTAAKH